MSKIWRPTGGHILDIDPQEVADQFLSLAQNVNTRKGFPSRIGGRRIAYPVSGGGAPTDALHLLNLNLNTFNWWMLFGPSDIFAVEGPNSHDISIAGQDTVGNIFEWSSTLLNGIPVFTNGKDDLSYWTGEGAVPAASVPDWPADTVCKFVVAFKFHLFAFNIDGPSGVFDNKLIWSNAAEPGALPDSWTPAADNEAGSSLIADTPGRIICGVPLNTQLMAYKPESIYAIEYVGRPDVYSVRPLIRSQGALGPHCVKELGTRHIVVGTDDIVLTDGINVQSIAENRIKNYLSNSIDETNAQNAFVMRDANKKETWVCVPESGSLFATVAHIWDERRDTWTTRDLEQVRYGTSGYVIDGTTDATWDADSEIWDSDISAWNQGTTGAVAHLVLSQENVLYVEDTVDLVSITGIIAKYDLVLGDDDEQNYLVQRVWISGTGLGYSAVEFRLGKRQSTDESITWSDFRPREVDGAAYEICGRYISIEIRAVGTLPWTVNRFEIEARPNGRF